MALTAITGVTKSTTQKSARVRELKAKLLTADSYVSCPPEAIKSLTLDIEGENDEGAFGTTTIGQKFVGKVLLYAADAGIKKFAHELVTNAIRYCQVVTNGGKTYTLAASSDTAPAPVEFSYGKANLATDTTKPELIELNITGYRDNLEIS